MSTLRRGHALACLLSAAVLLQACGGSAIDASQRAVVSEPAPLAWRPATRDDVPGFYVSEEIGGSAAGAVLSISYLFEADGRYTGAALALDAEGRPAFETLSGCWSWKEGRLDLGGGSERAAMEAAPGRLRLSTPSGTVVLRRESLH